jgi:hypothetical protein
MLKSELRVGQIFTITEKSEELGDNTVSVVICRILHYIDQAGVNQVSSVCYVVCQGQSRFLENATVYTINPTFFIENYGPGLVVPAVVEPTVTPVVHRVVFEIGNAQIRILKYFKLNRLVINISNKELLFDDDCDFMIDIDHRSLTREVYSMVTTLASEDDITEEQVKDTTKYLANMFRLFVPSFEMTSTL